MFDNINNLAELLNANRSHMIWGLAGVLTMFFLLLLICVPDLIFQGMKKFKKWEKEEEVKERMIEYGIKQKLEEKDK